MQDILTSETIVSYRAWRLAHDEGYCYDEIFNWVEGEVSRGELLRLMDAAALMPLDEEASHG